GLSAHSIQTVPAMLAQSITAAALAKGAAATGTTSTLIKGALKIMAWTKVKTAAVAVITLALVAGTTTVAVRKMAAPAFESNFMRMDSGALWKADPLVVVRPSRYAGQ